MNYFADVILPLPLRRLYTYSIPSSMFAQVKCGSRVVVPFGRKRFYTAIVSNIHNTKPLEYEVKDITEVLDSHPIIRSQQINLWNWISEYYLCSVGDVYKAALPSGLKLESETKLAINCDYSATEHSGLTEKEQSIITYLLGCKSAALTDIESNCNLKGALSVVRGLVDRDIVTISEELSRKYRPKTENFIKLTCDLKDNDSMRQLFEQLKGAKKQVTLLIAYIDIASRVRNEQGDMGGVLRKVLLEKSGVSSAVLLSMIKSGIFSQYKHEITRESNTKRKTRNINPLNEAQNTAYNAICREFSSKNVTLLHGVTSSGKTEIYIHLIQEVIKSGKQALFLVPEIALTTQLANRLAAVFGDKLGIYHSKYSDNQRVDVWQSLMRENKLQVILGVRSSVFLPFRNLGLIIIDEEHEGSYKQQEPSPRYNARSVAIVLASMYGAKVLLGSATPSIESYYNAQSGKFGFVELTKRYADLNLPIIEIADTFQLRRKKIMKGEISPQLREHCNDALSKNEQIILFRNRRGFAPMIECEMCAWVPKCQNCDVSLTYHKQRHQLTCHYCGYTAPVPTHCPACGDVKLQTKGFGTENIEEEAKGLFEGEKILRMDADTTRSRKAYEDLITNFEERKSNILIGTQMVTKGLDFAGVSVVGILGADSLLNLPDFRAHERAFQLMEQVAGRSGRQGRQGRVVLQTAQASHPIIEHLLTHNYRGFYEAQIAERMEFNYPPFTRLIYIFIKGANEQRVDLAAKILATELRSVFKHRVLGPDQPPVARIQSQNIRKIVLKTEVTSSPQRVREYIYMCVDKHVNSSNFKGVNILFDVDPV